MIESMPPSRVDPFSIMRVTLMEGGFFIVVPPAPIMAAEDGPELLLTVEHWLARDDTDLSDDVIVPTSAEEIPDAWPEDGCVLGAHLPLNSTFQIVRVRRHRNQHFAYHVLWHTASMDSAKSAILWGDARVMEAVRQWLLTPAHDVISPVRIESVKVAAEMPISEDGVHTALVQSATAAFGPTPLLASVQAGSPAYVISCAEPLYQWGVMDTPTVRYLSLALDGDTQGNFAAQLDGTTLRVGPRVDVSDGDSPILSS